MINGNTFNKFQLSYTSGSSFINYYNTVNSQRMSKNISDGLISIMVSPYHSKTLKICAKD